MAASFCPPDRDRLDRSAVLVLPYCICHVLPLGVRGLLRRLVRRFRAGLGGHLCLGGPPGGLWWWLCSGWLRWAGLCSGGLRWAWLCPGLRRRRSLEHSHAE